MRVIIRKAAQAVLDDFIASRKTKRRISYGSGKRSCLNMLPRRCKYSGSDLRAIRAVKGVGRPPRRAA